MLHVDAVKRGLEGQKHFAPLRAFDVEETRDMMCALLLHDLGHEGSSARPEWGRREDGDGRHPFDAFGATAAHGGDVAVRLLRGLDREGGVRAGVDDRLIGKAAYVLGSTIG